MFVWPINSHLLLDFYELWLNRFVIRQNIQSRGENKFPSTHNRQFSCKRRYCLGHRVVYSTVYAVEAFSDTVWGNVASDLFSTHFVHQQTVPALLLYTRQSPLDCSPCKASGPHYTVCLWPVGSKMTCSWMPLNLENTQQLHSQGTLLFYSISPHGCPFDSFWPCTWKHYSVHWHENTQRLRCFSFGFILETLQYPDLYLYQWIIKHGTSLATSQAVI